MTGVSNRTAATVVAVAVVIAAGIGIWRFQSMRAERSPVEPAAKPPIRVPLFVPADAVRHHGRFTFLWDGPAPLASFRQAEKLDAVIAGAGADEEAARKLMHWTRAQFEPGTPSPYPPPDATTTLNEIRSGRTGGFCAQYSFVLVQALQSEGRPARMVTIDGHEVVETWLRDQSRWTMLDPMFDLQVVDRSGRSLSAYEIRAAGAAGAGLALTPGHRLTEAPSVYFARYGTIAIWLRNAFTGAPVNFADFDRYRLWLVAAGEPSPKSESPSTSFPDEVYGPPHGFPVAGS